MPDKISEFDADKLTKAEFDALDKAYQLALKQKQDQFTCLGHTWYTKYVQYVLEYLDPKFKDMK